MLKSLPNEIHQSPSRSPKIDHISRARKLLAEELKAHFDHTINEWDLKLVSDLPPQYQNDPHNVSFGFSVGEGSAKKIFVIRFQVDCKGEPIFEMREIADPVYRILMFHGKNNLVFGRSQIERVLIGN